MRTVVYFLLASLLMVSCKGISFKQQRILRKTVRECLKTIDDSLYLRELNLQKCRVTRYKPSPWANPVELSSFNVSKDTFTVVQQTLVRGLVKKGEATKKLVNWKVILVGQEGNYRIIGKSHSSYKDISIYKQILVAIYCTVVICMFAWVSIGFQKYAGPIILYMFPVLMFIQGLFIFGSFLLSLLNVLFFLSIVSSIVKFFEGRAAK